MYVDFSYIDMFCYNNAAQADANFDLSKTFQSSDNHSVYNLHSWLLPHNGSLPKYEGIYLTERKLTFLVKASSVWYRQFLDKNLFRNLNGDISLPLAGSALGSAFTIFLKIDLTRSSTRYSHEIFNLRFKSCQKNE